MMNRVHRSFYCVVTSGYFPLLFLAWPSTISECYFIAVALTLLHRFNLEFMAVYNKVIFKEVRYYIVSTFLCINI